MSISRAAHLVSTSLLIAGFVLTAWGGSVLLDPSEGDFPFGAAGAFVGGMIIGVAGIVTFVVALIFGGIRAKRRAS